VTNASRSALLAVALLAASCVRGRIDDPAHAADLQPPSSFEADFLLHQAIVFERAGRQARLRAALQRRGDTMTLVALTPLGTRAFVVRQQGLAVSATSYAGGQLPFPPRLVLVDVQRALLPALGRSGPLRDGVHRTRSRSEVIEERWAGGRLRERRFAERSCRRGREIVIRYEGGAQPGHVPDRIVLENGRLGYRLTLTTLSYRPL
jgi:hypothetical protein